MRVFLLCLLCKILFLKKYRLKESNNIIFILLTDRPYFFAVLPVDQKINLLSPSLNFRLKEWISLFRCILFRRGVGVDFNPFNNTLTWYLDNAVVEKLNILGFIMILLGICLTVCYLMTRILILHYSYFHIFYFLRYLVLVRVVFFI